MSGVGEVPPGRLTGVDAQPGAAPRPATASDQVGEGRLTGTGASDSSCCALATTGATFT